MLREIDEWVQKIALAIVAIVLAALAVLYLVVMIGLWEHKYTVSVITKPDSPKVVQTLPQTCQKYYNDGTADWINCMGVGYK